MGGGSDDPVERALVDERRRIAREIHDVVAHQVTATVLQARAAGAAVRSDPDRAQAYLLAIEETATSTLDELRELMGVLRAGDDLAPVPASAPVDPSRSVRASDLLGVQAVVHRIVLEALTNVLRHAGLVDVSVSVTTTDDAIEVVVTNQRPRGAAPVASAGTGLGSRGMRERAEALGGTFDAGPTPEGGWTVRAVIPTSDQHVDR